MFNLLKRSRLFCLIAITLLMLGNAQANPLNALFHQTSDPVSGNPKGKVTVVEFFDYQCSHCIDMVPVITNILQKNPSVRVVFKEFPIRGPLSERASRAALAANLQGKYWPLHHAMLTSNAPLTDAVIFKLAKENGIDVDKLIVSMNSKAISKELDATQRLAQTLNISGTPAFFIGPTNAKQTSDVIFVLGQMDEKQLQQLIDKNTP